MLSVSSRTDFEGVHSSIRTAQRLMEEAKLYQARQPVLARKLLIAARKEFSAALNYARTNGQNSQRLLQAIHDVEELLMGSIRVA